jgi:hypothetical protein
MNSSAVLFRRFRRLKRPSSVIGSGKHVAIVGAAILALAMIVAPAHADFQIATFTNVSPGEVVTISKNGNPESGWAGYYNFVNGSGLINGSFHGLCIDIGQNIYYNQTVTFGVAQLENAPTPGVAMGVNRANLVRELWYSDYTASAQSNSNAAAFEIAIWEIINESSGNPLNVTTGQFTVSANASTLATANAWLQALDLTGNGPRVSNLMALTNDSYQDYAVEVPGVAAEALSTPAPPGWVLALVGTAIIACAYWYRKARVSSAVACPWTVAPV